MSMYLVSPSWGDLEDLEDLGDLEDPVHTLQVSHHHHMLIFCVLLCVFRVARLHQETECELPGLGWVSDDVRLFVIPLLL